MARRGDWRDDGGTPDRRRNRNYIVRGISRDAQTFCLASRPRNGTEQVREDLGLFGDATVVLLAHHGERKPQSQKSLEVMYPQFAVFRRGNDGGTPERTARCWRNLLFSLRWPVP